MQNIAHVDTDLVAEDQSMSLKRMKQGDVMACICDAAPCLVFTQDDLLQHQYLQDIAGTTPTRVHLCPSSEGFLRAIQAGLGFGLLPELQVQSYLDNGALLDLSPGYALDTPLYWHYWQTESPLLQLLRQRMRHTTKQFLYQA